MMRKLFNLSIQIILSCLVLSGCNDTIEENVDYSSVVEQSSTNALFESSDEKVNNDKTDEVIDSKDIYDHESYLGIDIADLSNQVIDFSYGKGWFLDNSSNTWTCIDVEGNILFTLPADYEPVSGFVQNICLAQRNGYRKILINEKGDRIFPELSREDNEIVMLSECNGEINIWFRIIKDTFIEHSEILRIIDGEGRILSEYRSVEESPFDEESYVFPIIELDANGNKIGEFIGLLRLSISGMNEPGNPYSQIRDLGDSMYQYNGFVFNMNDYSCFYHSEKIKNFDKGYGVRKDGKLIDSNGTVVVSTPYETRVGEYCDGVYFIGYWKEIFYKGRYYDTYRGAFYNANGQVALDISQYSLQNIPSFENGYCFMHILNEAGVTFTAVMDRNGEFLFEPVQGSYNVEISDGMIVVNGDSIKIYDLNQNTTNTLSDNNIKRIGAFHDGWATFETSSRSKGFIDKNGNHLRVKLLPSQSLQ